MDDIVRAALAASPVVDGHNDLPAGLRQYGYGVEGFDVGLPDLHTDLPRLRAGGVGAQFWSVWVPSHLTEPEAVVATLEQVDAVHRLVAANPDDLALATTADDVQRAFAEGKIASLLGMEGGHSIAESLGVLRSFARLGVRYMTLTHNDSTSWADSATGSVRADGLDGTGRAIVAEMNRIGMLVDLSHVAATTMHAALDVTTAPVIFSHSSCRAVCDHVRNAGDDVLRRLGDNGGVLQLTFVPAFISPEYDGWETELRKQRAELLPAGTTDWPWPRAPRPGEDPAVPAAEFARELAGRDVDPHLGDWLAANSRPDVTVAMVADHVEHARDVAGVDHIGIGGDYDGTDRLPTGLEDVSGYPLLLGELTARGWSQDELEALTGRNVLRVLRAAEDAAETFLAPGAGSPVSNAGQRQARRM